MSHLAGRLQVVSLHCGSTSVNDQHNILWCLRFRHNLPDRVSRGEEVCYVLRFYCCCVEYQKWRLFLPWIC